MYNVCPINGKKMTHICVILSECGVCFLTSYWEYLYKPFLFSIHDIIFLLVVIYKHSINLWISNLRCCRGWRAWWHVYLGGSSKCCWELYHWCKRTQSGSLTHLRDIIFWNFYLSWWILMCFFQLHQAPAAIYCFLY